MKITLPKRHRDEGRIVILKVSINNNDIGHVIMQHYGNSTSSDWKRRVRKMFKDSWG